MASWVLAMVPCKTSQIYLATIEGHDAAFWGPFGGVVEVLALETIV